MGIVCSYGAGLTLMGNRPTLRPSGENPDSRPGMPVTRNLLRKMKATQEWPIRPIYKWTCRGSKLIRSIITDPPPSAKHGYVLTIASEADGGGDFTLSADGIKAGEIRPARIGKSAAGVWKTKEKAGAAMKAIIRNQKDPSACAGLSVSTAWDACPRLVYHGWTRGLGGFIVPPYCGNPDIYESNPMPQRKSARGRQPVPAKDDPGIDGFVRFRCDLADKGEWVRKARTAGKTLSEWIIERLNSR